MANTEAKKCEFCGAPRESRVVVSLDPQPLRDFINRAEQLLDEIRQAVDSGTDHVNG